METHSKKCVACLIPNMGYSHIKMTPTEMLEAILESDCPKVTVGEYEIHVLDLHCQYAVIVNSNEVVYFKIEYDEYDELVNEIVAKIKEGKFPE